MGWDRPGCEDGFLTSFYQASHLGNGSLSSPPQKKLRETTVSSFVRSGEAGNLSGAFWTPEVQVNQYLGLPKGGLSAVSDTFVPSYHMQLLCYPGLEGLGFRAGGLAFRAVKCWGGGGGA